MNEENTGCLEGTIEEIIYADRESGYSVCVIDCMGEPVTVVGTMPSLVIGETIRVNGKWSVHPSFGRQFKADFVEHRLPDTKESILRYLSSKAVRGIGPTLAGRIVDMFEEQSLDIIEHHPAWLADVKGISPSKAQEIHQSYMQQAGMRSAITEFGQFFGLPTAVRIFKRYGPACVETVKQNPYRLCEDLVGIRFDKTDAYAKHVGFSLSAPERIRAGILYVLMDSAYQGGHCKLPTDSLIAKCARELEIDDRDAEAVALSMEKTGELIVTEDAEHRYDAVPMLDSAERYVAEKAVAISESRLLFKIGGVEERIKGLENEFGIQYDDEQKQAILTASTHGLTILTGGPGTGKTTIVRALLAIFRDLKMSCALAAPTGRAAKRMSEACGKEAKTIHRLLEAAPGEQDVLVFKRDEETPLKYDVVIIDEMSMVDILLMESLLRAIRLGTRVVLIGDIDQLPPVGPGSCLSAMLKSERFFSIRLKTIHRQAEESLIVTNAHRINRGEMPVLSKTDSDFFFLKEPDAEQTRQALLALCTTRLPNYYRADPSKDIQVICITRKGPLGTVELNPELQRVLNPPSEGKREKKSGTRVFRERDKVMQVRNNYDLTWDRDGEEGEGIFNGDIGTILFINMQGEYLRIDFDGRICDYDFSLLEDLEHAYAITTHKSQGSEYRIVVIPSFPAPYPLMTRNLLYTAVTRAKEAVCMVGDPNVVARMTKNDRIPVRYSSLPDLLSF
ncbi:MAG: ATP-dependent RecD-like DNA helicase [Clostridia bacterium]|nr:ATP-dependent RecD-like DNA helicase [Clostridia bacterium]